MIALDQMGRRVSQLPSITLRRFPFGYEILDEARLDPERFLDNKDSILLYIHGINTTRMAADAAYAGFDERVGDVGAHRMAVFWPGDRFRRQESTAPDPNTVRQLYSAAQFDALMDNAEASAERLWRLLEAMVAARIDRLGVGIFASPLKVYIVAHSLGCLVTLKLLQLFPSRLPTSGLAFPVVALMAAAVPQDMVKPGGPLRQGLERPDHLLVYWSGWDVVLRLAFPAGRLLSADLKQLLLGEDRSAIGLTGLKAAGNVRPRYGSRGHGGYWPDPHIPAEVAEAIRTGHVTRELARDMGISEYVI